MTTRTFATYSPTAHSTELELEESNLVVVHNTTSDNLSRIARADLGRSAGRFYFETILYGEDGDVTKAAVGIAKSTQSLTQYLGQSTDSIGWRPGTGEVYTNGSAALSGLNVATLGQVVGVLVDLDLLTATFYLNGSPIGSIAIGAGTWFPAVSLGGDVAYDLRAFTNFGQRAFEFTFADQPDGWYEDSTPLATLYIAGRSDWISAPTDSPANQVFPKHLNPSGAFYERGVNFMPWGGSPIRRAGLGVLRVQNPHLGNDAYPYDAYVAADVRREAVRVRMALEDETLTQADVAAVALLDRIDSDGFGAVRMTLRDSLSLLDEPLQRRLFPPSTPVEAARNQPVPITLGAVRNMAPVLIDETNRIYALHDAPVTNLAAVKDKGDPLDPSASVPDYQLSDDYRNLVLANLPEGKLTADISSSGDVAVAPGVVDVLAGIGEFESTTWTEGTLFGTNTDEDPDRPIYIDTPAGWEVAPSATVPSGDDAVYIDSGDYGWLTFGSTWIGSGGASARVSYAGGDALRLGSLNKGITGGTPWMLRTSANVLEAGKTYRWRLEVAYIGGTDSNLQSGTGAFVLAAAEVGVGDDVLLRVNAPGVYSGYFTASANARLYVGVLRWDDTNRPKVAMVRGLIVEELQAFEEAELQGITFAEFQRQVLGVRGGLPDGAWSEADAQAIDEAAPYPFGYFTDSEVSILDAASAPLNSLLASMYPDRDGVIRFARLRKPEDADDVDVVLDLSAANLQGEFEVRTDLAPGLTTRIGVRRNWSRYGESDFVDDLVEVTATTRRRYMAEAQIIVASAVNLAGPYRFARNAPPFISLLDDPLHGQAVIDEWCGFYTAPRAFYANLRVKMEATVDVNPGDIVRLTFPRYGLGAGLKLYTTTVREDWEKQELVLTAWGLKLE